MDGIGYRTRRWIVKVSLGLAGFLLPFNLYLIPWLPRTPRAADAIGILFILGLVGTFVLYKRCSRQLLIRSFIVFIVLMPLFGHAVYSTVSGTNIYALRWLLAIAWGVVLWIITSRTRYRPVVLKGMLYGSLACAGVVIMQVAGLFELTQRLGFASLESVDDVVFRSIWRAPGMEANVNGSAAIISLALPIVLGLVDEKRLKSKWVYLVLGVVLISSAITLNRSSVLISGLTFTVWLIRAEREFGPLWKKLGVVMILVSAVIYVGPPGGWERWETLENLSTSSNFEVRAQTTVTATALALENPLGTGISYKDDLRNNSGVGSGSTHNALLQVALLGGWPIALALLWKFGWLSCYLFRRTSVEQWLALHLLSLFFFEEYLSNMTIMVICVWILLKPFNEIVGRKRLARRRLKGVAPDV
jgi:hypothetical protein